MTNTQTHRGFTLIEIIFTIVIMAGVFAVIPKILMIASKNESFAMKQDAYLNAISLTKLASSLAWDEVNTQSLDVLTTANSPILCDNTTQFIRKGSFLSTNARSCNDALSASTIASEEGTNYLDFDDIDDFDKTTTNVTENGVNRYMIDTNVTYLDPHIAFATNTMTIDLNASITTATSANLKKLVTTIKYNGKKAVQHGRQIATFHYISANIGQFTLNKRDW